MRCISPIRASFDKNGELTFKARRADPGIVGFQFPCRKCLPCRLNIAREKAVRCVHEAQIHDDNIFLTLTYSDENLKSPWLDYSDFQKFMKKLRKTVQQKLNYVVTGEYGDISKRPHWHAIIFNYRPHDTEYYYTSDGGDRVYTSKIIDKIWQKNDPEKVPNQIGSVTIDSAGYVARYAAKKLTHGQDQDHDYHPIHKTSSKRAIGRTWIEKYYKRTFENGNVILPDGTPTKIPRYYQDWCKDHQPELYYYYLEHVRPKIEKKAELDARKDELEYLTQMFNQTRGRFLCPETRTKVKLRCLESKFKKLQEHLKL